MFQLIVKNIHFNGIEFAHTSVETMLCLSTSCDGQSASFLTTALFHTRFTKNIIIDNCTFRNTGGYAVWFDRGSIDNILSNNNLIDLGAGAVRIGEPAVNVDLADGNKIINIGTCNKYVNNSKRTNKNTVTPNCSCEEDVRYTAVLSTLTLTLTLLRVKLAAKERGVGLQSLWDRVVAQKGLFVQGSGARVRLVDQSGARAAASVNDISHNLPISCVWSQKQIRYPLFYPSRLSQRHDR